jgi:hypothetical protein
MSVRVKHKILNNTLGRRAKDYIETQSFEMKRTIGK